MTVSTDAVKAGQELERGLLELISLEPWTRRAAAERIAVTTPAARQALRRALFHDSAAAVRASAARRLGSCAEGATEACSWLCDAALDATPLVREAALRALARLLGGQPSVIASGPEAAAALCQKLLFEDAVWWVRRAAVLALFALRGAAAIDDLRRALGDPFWRVRHTAVQALLVVGDTEPPRRSQILGGAAELPALVQSGLWYLRARWQPEVEVHAFAAPPLPDEGFQNADPAVMTARLRARSPESIDPFELLPLLADPHEPLRRLAMARLRARPELPVLRGALAWLKTPGPPHASDAVTALLNRLGEPARVLCEEVLRADSPECGALIWASRFAAATGAVELRGPLLSQMRAPKQTPPARVALIGALVSLTDGESTGAEIDELITALLDAQRDADVDVRSAAVMGLVRFAVVVPERIMQALWTQPLDLYRPLAACALVDLARRLRDKAQLQQAAWSAHPLPQAQALDALARLGALADSNRDVLLTDVDPAVRASVLRSAPPEIWLRTLKQDVDPLVRRRALALLIAQRRRLTKALGRAAAESCGAAADAWLRVRGCELFDAHDEADRKALITLLHDSHPGVRAAAAARFEAVGDEDLFASRRIELLEKGAAAAAADRTKETPKRAAARDSGLSVSAPRRMLGRTGIAVSPLGLSGAYDPPPSAMAQALRAGVNFVFWEPRYFGMTRFLRRTFAGEIGPRNGIRRSDIVVAAGSFEGDRHGIERDLAQALRRLGTDYIDVFLLLWVRSPERLSSEVKQCLRELKQSGRIRACGFSTHHRELAEQALLTSTSAADEGGDSARVFDVLMLRHSAAHPAAEDRLLPLCAERQIGVITFSTLCYGRLLRAASASECYCYSLAQPGVSACWSAPRSLNELQENLEVLPSLGTPLSQESIDRLRAYGQEVRKEDRRFSALLRKGHEGAPEALRALDLVDRLDAENTEGDDELYRGVPGIVQKGVHPALEQDGWASAASFHAAMERRGRP